MKKYFVLILSFAAVSAIWSMEEDINKQLIQASKDCDREQAVQLLNQGADVNAANGKGRSVLHYAARNGCYALANLFLKKGAKVDLPDNEGYAPLHFAAVGGDSDTVGLLVWNNADSAVLGGEYKTSPLMWAAKNGHEDACLEILTAISKQDTDKFYNQFRKLEPLIQEEFPYDWEQRLKTEVDTLIKNWVNDRMEKAIFLMNQQSQDNITASQMASMQNDPELAALLDPNNKKSLEEIREEILEFFERAFEDYSWFRDLN